MKVILQAKEIPAGAIVTKLNGANQYTLCKTIDIYMLDGKKVIAEDGVMFLKNEYSAHAISENIELIWHVDQDQLYDFLYEIIEDK